MYWSRGWAMVAVGVAWLAAGFAAAGGDVRRAAVLIAAPLASPSVVFGLVITTGVDRQTV